MTRQHRGTMRAPLLAILLMFAFLAHDAWMVDAHAGQIVYTAADNAPAMGEHTHAGHHGTSPIDAAQPETELTTLSPPMMMTCESLRTGTLGQPTSVPGPNVSLVVLSGLDDAPDHLDVCGRVDWPPPGQSPDVRRAFLQVYRE